MTVNFTRASESREKKERKKEYRPPAMLDVPTIEGMRLRWKRRQTVNQEDEMNIAMAIRDGWEPVKAEEIPGFSGKVTEHGKYTGVVGAGDLILMKKPEEEAKLRDKYYEDLNARQMEAIDQELEKGQNPLMPITRSRKSRVTIGHKEDVKFDGDDVEDVED